MIFDKVGDELVKEPFVSGIPEMLDILVQDLPHHNEGFKLLFSASPFPKYQAELIWDN